MMDPRIEKLASNLVNYSCKVKAGEHVLIEYVGDEPQPLAKAIVRAVTQVGAYPHVQHTDRQLLREQLMGMDEKGLQVWQDWERLRMEAMDCYIGFSGGSNVNELSDVPSDKMNLYQSMIFREIHGKIRINSTRWCVLRYPSPGMAQMADMSTEAFENFYYDVCTLDYGKMAGAMENLKALMEKTDRVRITGPGTDLSFSIKGLPAIPCAGEVNIPDGEVFTAPVKDSVNGTLSYNTPAVYQGFTYDNIKLTFKDGKIVDAIANDTEKINEVFDTDEGARYVGEFAIGVNPYVIDPMKDTLFDEKIMGSFHFTPGNAYDDCDNGNKSAVHWDLVCIQTPEYGGGEIYFDDVLIRKDGRFVVADLEALNPENLK